MKNSLLSLGLKSAKRVFDNLSSVDIIEHALERQEGHLSNTGALVVKTGAKTGRSASDKFIVADATSQDQIWWGNNQRLSEAGFERLEQKMMAYLADTDLYVQDLLVGAEPDHSLQVRVITELAWHSLFVRNLFIRPTAEQLQAFDPELTVISAPGCKANPAIDHTRSETFIVLNFAKKLILIGGTAYAGEIKKAVFTVMNYLMPQRGVLPMHCAANLSADGHSAIFFGLSGTGKTSLSADPAYRLIGDDEHCWSDTSVFNIEGGCYAKCINLTPATEPLIYNAIRHGAVVENVILDPHTAQLDFSDNSLTENTRCAYPLEYIPNPVLPSIGPQPNQVVFLTCDAFGVLPPIAKLTPNQAMYYFLLGYTAKVAGTEIGVTEPKATFSPCFGAPFLPLHPAVYARLLGEKLRQEKVQCWLVNTGWTGGAYGIGQRLQIAYTRRLLKAALSGQLNSVSYVADPIFGVAVPTACPEVPKEILLPRNTWREQRAYDQQACRLAQKFIQNFEEYRKFVSPDVVAAAPSLKTCQLE